MANALEFWCETCKTRAPHPVSKTWPDRFRWDDETTCYFQLRFGRDVDYRKRQRICSSCEERLATVELPVTTLGQMIEEIHRLSRDLAKFTAEAPEVNKHLAGAVRLVEEIFMGGATLKLRNGSKSEFDRLVAALEAALNSLEHNEEAAVRWAYGLWSAPSTPPPGIARGELLAKLRHPSRATLLREFLG